MDAVPMKGMYIRGEWVRPADSAVIEAVNPTTTAVVARVPAGSAKDVDEAVAAAVRAFPRWAGTPVATRAGFLRRISAALLDREEEIVRACATDIGSTIATGRSTHVRLPATTFASMADIIESAALEKREGNVALVKEPVGVVGAITPWNYPLHQIAAKVAPALAAGCTIVLKPSEVAPLSPWILAEIMSDVGLPAGVFNLVSGSGPVVGEALARHPDVDMVSFTGSVAAGTRVAELAAATVKRVTLELGGKSACIVLDDAGDLRAIVEGVVTSLMANAGQTCSALTRLLVPRRRLGEAERFARDCAARQRVGDPADPGTTLGPVVSEAQYRRVRACIEQGIAEGATLVAGGLERPAEAPPKGYFIAPTVFSDVTGEMMIAREEIFGPVLSIMPYETEEEAVEIANGTGYGLSGAVWSGSEARAVGVARRIRTGQVKINGGAFSPTAPFGGYKRSGVGRELGPLGLEEYFEVKALIF